FCSSTESPNLLQCGTNNHDGYEKSVLRKRHCLLLMEAIQGQVTMNIYFAMHDSCLSH
ncbi:unnamed protein product, partial [Musa textilis]